MEQPSIEITYDPTIKVRGITEELFKQQPEGKFVLKPFTIISKKVYKNFTDRSHAFNYLLKFLKKKSKEDNNVILKVFSEPRKKKRMSLFPSLFPSLVEFFQYSLARIFLNILRPFQFFFSIKRFIQSEDSFDTIMSKEHKENIILLMLEPFFFVILSLTSGYLIAPVIISLLKSEDLNPFPLYTTIYLVIFFIVYPIASAVLEIMIEKKNPLMMKFLEIYFIMKSAVSVIEKSKGIRDKKTILVINFNIFSHFDIITSLNFALYLLDSVAENSNIEIIFHAPDSYFLFSIKERLTMKQLTVLSLYLETSDYKKDIKIFESSELNEENIPLHYNEYKWAAQREELKKENEQLELEKKQLERENKEQLARLIQSAKLESMNITTSGVSHEIRNPLSIIQLVIENLRLDKNLNREVLAEDLDKIQTQVSRIFKLTETFQKYSSQKSLTRKSIDSQITNSLSFFEQRLLSNKIEVNYEKPEERIGAIEFSEELSIVLENLISNSIDALSGNEDAIIRIKVSLEENKLCVLFSDNGHGIPKEHFAEIFTPLFTTKGPGKGTGLGLWLCRKLITEDFKGNITVDSTPNEDTTFTILLPVDGDGNVQQ